MARIFVSYSRSDRPFIDRFIPLIRRVYGMDSVWYDDAIHGGADWWQMILDEIDRCDLFVYLISNESLESPYCQAELREALRLNKQFLPVIVRRLKPPYPGHVAPDLASILSRTQYVDMADGFRDPETTAALYAAINRLLEAVPQRLASPPADTPTPEPPVPDGKQPAARRRALAVAVGIALGAVVLVGLLGLLEGSLVNVSGTADPAVTALQRWENSSQTNADWSPVERDFDGVAMVLVPAGCFDMGSDTGEDDEQPTHSVCLDEPFWIDRYEVTNAQYGSVGCEEWSSEPDQPRNCVNWFDARDHCAARGARLPTEAEWEYAARGPDGPVYPWGNTYDADRVIGLDDPSYGGSGTAPVGSRPGGASWVGALDMSGSLWEWTSSLYESYPYGDDHEDANDAGSLRVLRGASFDFASDFLRAAYRYGDYPDFVGGDYGLRCARSYG